jgi:hypothetical protein
MKQESGAGSATRTLSIVLGFGAVGLAVALAWQGMSRWKPVVVAIDGGDAAYTSLEGDGGFAVIDWDSGPEQPVREFRDGGVGFMMPDGTPVPPLPPGTPKIVRFGVVLVAYAGAEDAPRGARTKHDALELAQKLSAQAKTDFHAAVRRGDEGSSDDVGSMRHGVLEPAPEYVLFSLPQGGVSDPIDTPRGYWIIKRND